MNRLVAPPATTNLKPSTQQQNFPQSSSTAFDTLAPALPNLPLDGAEFQRDIDWPIASFAPQHYEPGYAYPLVVWLHAKDQSERDLPVVMSHISTRNYVAVAPRGVVEWDKPWPQDAQSMAEAEDIVFEAVAAAREQFNVHDDRIFLAGVGSGGTTAVRLALANPHRFAGAASFDGPAPEGNSPLRNLNSVRGLPLMFATGRESERYAVDRFCDDLRLLHSAGCQLTLWQEAGNGELTVEMLSQFDKWAMDIVCG